MQVSKINNFQFSHSVNALKNAANLNFKGMLIPQGREEASWSNAGGMGESYYDRYEYIPTKKETPKQREREIERLAKKAAKLLPDNDMYCSYGVLIDIHDEKEGFIQRYFDKSVSEK